MTTKFIAENILDADDFSSATEQSGEHAGQPTPGSGNTGSFKLITNGGADFVYNGTTTANGAGGGTTVVDTNTANRFGADRFINATIEITSGAADGETKTVTAFTAAGTFTVGAFSAQIVSGVTFTLTLALASMNFITTLDASGDAGDATYKMSHDGGTTYFGRDNPLSGAYGGAHDAIAGDLNGSTEPARLIQASDGTIVCMYNRATPSTTKCVRSSNYGLTWGAAITIISGSYSHEIEKLSNGRLLVVSIDNPAKIYYSDDNAATWAQLISDGPTDVLISSLCELYNGNLIAVGVWNDGASWDTVAAISSDGGATWGDRISIYEPPANDTANPYVEQAENGNIVCVFSTDEDAANDSELECCISSDGGATWGTPIDVLDYSVGVIEPYRPCLLRDIDGTLICSAADVVTSGTVYTYSQDNGKTWAASQTLVDSAGFTDYGPGLALIDGAVWAAINGDGDIKTYYGGYWIAYSANGAACAINGYGHRLAAGVKAVWHGGAGVSGDTWTFTPEYKYAMSNIVDGFPRRSWRSQNDNAASYIVIDMGANARHEVDGVAFFGCNMRTLSFQMHTADSWGTPDVDESVSFDLTSSGVIDSVNGNHIVDAALMASYKDHELRPSNEQKTFLRATAGVDSGITWAILDNVGDNIILDTTASHNMVATDTFAIFQSQIAATFTGATRRFIRIAIDAQQTADDYYQIGCAVMGRTISLSHDFGPGYTRQHKQNVDIIRPAAGGMITQKRGGRNRIWQLQWPASNDAQQEIEALLDYINGGNIAFIPDHGTLTDAYLVKLINDPSYQQVFDTRYKFSVTLEENI